MLLFFIIKNNDLITNDDLLILSFLQLINARYT